MIYITKKGSKFIIVDKPDGKISKDVPTITLEDFTKKEQIKLLDRIDPKKLLIELRQRLKSSKFKKGVKKLRSSLKSKKIKITNRKLNKPVQPKNVVYPEEPKPKPKLKVIPKEVKSNVVIKELEPLSHQGETRQPFYDTKTYPHGKPKGIHIAPLYQVVGTPQINPELDKIHNMIEEEEKEEEKKTKKIPPPLPPRNKLESLKIPESQENEIVETPKRKHKSPKSPSTKYLVNKTTIPKVINEKIKKSLLKKAKEIKAEQAEEARLKELAEARETERKYKEQLYEPAKPKPKLKPKLYKPVEPKLAEPKPAEPGEATKPAEPAKLTPQQQKIIDIQKKLAKIEEKDEDDLTFSEIKQERDLRTELAQLQEPKEEGTGLGGKLNLDEVNAFNKASYAKKKNAEKVNDYVLDRSLSSKENKVYYNPINGKVVIANAGTSGVLDWWNNKNILFGNYETTDRYKDLENIQKEAINKYGLKNITNVGHSQSGEALRILANKGLTHEAVALNPAILGKSHEGVDVIRSSRDPVSLLTPMGENDLTIQGTTFNPITEHRRDILDRVPNKEVGTGLEDEAWEILEHPHHHNMELVKKAHKHIQSVLKLKSPNNRMVNRQVMSGRGKMIMRHPALQSAESVLTPGAFANLGLGLGGEIGDGLYAGNLKDKLSGMYNKIPHQYHAPIEAIGKQSLHDVGFGLSAQSGGAFNLKDKLNNVWHHHIPQQYHPHIEAIGKQALHDVGYGFKQDMNKLDSFLYKMSNFGMGLSHFGNFDRIPEKYRPFAKMATDELGASMLRSYNPFARGLTAQGGDLMAQYRDTFDPHSEEGGNLKDSLSKMYNKIPQAYHAPIEAIGKQSLKDLGFGLQAQGGKLTKGSPEMKERMAKMRAMKGKKMKGGDLDLPPRSRSYVTSPSLL